MAESLPTRSSRRSLPDIAGWLDLEFPTLFHMFDRPMRFDKMVRIEQVMDGDTLVVRAELPGIDPDKDVEITVRGDELTIAGSREEEKREEQEGMMLSEFRYGSFARTIRLPKGITGDDVSASYKDGILEVRVPMPPAEAAPGTRVAIARG